MRRAGPTADVPATRLLAAYGVTSGLNLVKTIFKPLTLSASGCAQLHFPGWARLSLLAEQCSRQLQSRRDSPNDLTHSEFPHAPRRGMVLLRHSLRSRPPAPTSLPASQRS